MHKISNAEINNWLNDIPELKQIVKYQPIFWDNKHKINADQAFKHLALQYPPLNEAALQDAEERLLRFAPLIAALFPETRKGHGLIESELVEIPAMKQQLQNQFGQNFSGRLLLKCDSHLPVVGSIKARGGIYEVLKHAEDLALKAGLLKKLEDYSQLAQPDFKRFFNQYALAVGSTGNLGLSIGITGAALGFNTTVHMSQDAKAWKKDLLRSQGVQVIEYASDYSQAVAEGRKESLQKPHSFFIDDENSLDLFLGYSVAALRLKKQLEDINVTVDSNHPLFVYLPCGVGGAPGGICYGLKTLFKDHVHCFFSEPTHSPCMLIGLLTGQNEKVSVFDFGLDNRTEADGLAVGRPSGLVGKVIGELVSGIYTVTDDDLYRLLVMLADSEQVYIEPSATPGLLGPAALFQSQEGRTYLQKNQLEKHMPNATHIAWATGGALVPEYIRRDFYRKGKYRLDKSEGKSHESSPR